MAVTIRPAVEADYKPCAALYERVVRETFTWFPPEELTDGPFWDAAPTEELYVAVDGERLLGFASYFRGGGFLHSLYIDADARSRGVGSALFDHVRGIANGPISLKVQKLNTDAIAFYERRGLRTVESGGEDQPGGGWFRMMEQA